MDNLVTVLAILAMIIAAALAIRLLNGYRDERVAAFPSAAAPGRPSGTTHARSAGTPHASGSGSTVTPGSDGRGPRHASAPLAGEPGRRAPTLIGE